MAGGSHGNAVWESSAQGKLRETSAKGKSVSGKVQLRVSLAQGKLS